MEEPERKQEKVKHEPEDELVCEPYEVKGFFSGSWDEDTYYCHEEAESDGQGSVVRKSQLGGPPEREGKGVAGDANPRQPES